MCVQHFKNMFKRKIKLSKLCHHGNLLNRREKLRSTQPRVKGSTEAKKLMN